jgi:hypothetical protein
VHTAAGLDISIYAILYHASRVLPSLNHHTLTLTLPLQAYAEEYSGPWHYSPVPAAVGAVQWSDGNTSKLWWRERPQVHGAPPPPPPPFSSNQRLFVCLWMFAGAVKPAGGCREASRRASEQPLASCGEGSYMWRGILLSWSPTPTFSLAFVCQLTPFPQQSHASSHHFPSFCMPAHTISLAFAIQLTPLTGFCMPAHTISLAVACQLTPFPKLLQSSSHH